MSAERAVYLDSSAIVKLCISEAETSALRRHLARRRRWITSGLARTEVVRTVSAGGPSALQAADDLLRRITLVKISDRILRSAGTIGPPSLRSLDAIHLATAVVLGDDVARICTYDRRMAEVATDLGFTVVAPS